MAFSSYGNDQYGLNSDTYSLYTSANNDRWSTCFLSYFSWLLDHIIYLKLKREQFFWKAEKIHKMALKIVLNKQSFHVKQKWLSLL